jgi:hypothetical protein
MTQLKTLVPLVVAAALPWTGTVATAQDAEGPEVSFAAFGTVGAVHSDERQADFGRTQLPVQGVDLFSQKLDRAARLRFPH